MAASAVASIGMVSASAEYTDSSDMTVTYNRTDNKLTVTLKSGKDVTGQTAIVIADGDYTAANAVIPEDKILYVNQQTADTAKATGGFLTSDGVLPKDSLGTAETAAYTIRIGYANQTGFYQAAYYPNGVNKVKYGDVTGDGAIDGSDALQIINHFLGKTTLTGDSFTAADVTGDGTVDGSDALQVVNYFLGKINSFPVEQD